MARDALTAAIGRYPHTEALLDERVRSDRFALAVAPVSPINRAFAPMVREGRFAISEMAIATVLQAKACRKPIVLLPVVLAARFQEAALLCRAESDLRGPGDLVGRRIGVRSYSQTTGLWLRGILAESHGVPPDAVRWTTWEDAHVAEIRDPPFVARAAPGTDMMGALAAGDLDAVIVGNEVPRDAGLRTVFPDPAAAGEAFRARHGFVPVNHLLTVRQDVAEAHPDALAELLRLVRDSAAGVATAVPVVQSRAALAPAIRLALAWADRQGLLPGPLGEDDVWRGTPATVA